MDEHFFLLYNLQIKRQEFFQYPINERKYIIAKFLEQKEKEHEYLQKKK